jgi:tetratricopeptide (TPR) repeat protein
MVSFRGVEYDDFIVQILPVREGSHEVRIDSPAGQGKSRFAVPPGLRWDALETGGRDLVRQGERSGTNPVSAREIGDRLFQALFIGEARDLLVGSLRKSPDRGLRIRLRLDPEMAEVLALPWECLHLPESSGFLGLSRRILFVVAVDLPQPLEPPLAALRLRVLAVASSPRGLPRLDLGSECRHLEAAARWHLWLKVSLLIGAGREQLREALLRGLRKLSRPFHVLHFMGHGSFERGEGVLLFTRPDGGPQRVSGRELASELEGFSALRLVVLNACHSARAPESSGFDPFAGVALALVRNGVPAVIAMRSRIPDRAAIVFTRALYRRLAAGDPVDVAIAEARLAIERQGGSEGIWSVPVLFLRGPHWNLIQRTPIARRLAAGLIVALLAGGLGVGAYRNVEALHLNNQGVALASQGRDREARKVFTEALRLVPRYAPAHANLTDVEERQGNYAAALAHAEAAVEISPDQALYQYNLGRIRVRMGYDEAALGPLQRAARRRPCFAEALNELASAYLSLDLPAAALRAAEDGLRCDPEIAPLYKNLGRSALAEGRPGAAVSALEEAVRRYARTGRQDREEPTYWLAEAHARAGERRLACQSLQELWNLTHGIGPHRGAAKRLAQLQGCGGVF